MEKGDVISDEEKKTSILTNLIRKKKEKLNAQKQVDQMEKVKREEEAKKKREAEIKSKKEKQMKRVKQKEIKSKKEKEMKYMKENGVKSKKEEEKVVVISDEETKMSVLSNLIKKRREAKLNKSNVQKGTVGVGAQNVSNGNLIKNHSKAKKDDQIVSNRSTVDVRQKNQEGRNANTNKDNSRYPTSGKSVSKKIADQNVGKGWDETNDPVAKNVVEFVSDSDDYESSYYESSGDESSDYDQSDHKKVDSNHRDDCSDKDNSSECTESEEGSYEETGDEESLIDSEIDNSIVGSNSADYENTEDDEDQSSCLLTEETGESEEEKNSQIDAETSYKDGSDATGKKNQLYIQ